MKGTPNADLLSTFEESRIQYQPCEWDGPPSIVNHHSASIYGAWTDSTLQGKSADSSIVPWSLTMLTSWPVGMGLIALYDSRRRLLMLPDFRNAIHPKSVQLMFITFYKHYFIDFQGLITPTLKLACCNSHSLCNKFIQTYAMLRPLTIVWCILLERPAFYTCSCHVNQRASSSVFLSLSPSLDIFVYICLKLHSKYRWKYNSLFAAVSSCKMSLQTSPLEQCFLPKPNAVVDPPETYQFGICSSGSDSLNCIL